MSSLLYSEIFSTVYSKAQMYDFLDLTELQANEYMCNWLRSAISKPYVRKLFSSISLDDEIQELSYDITYVLDESSDKYFIIEVLALGVLHEWITPKVISLQNIAQNFGSSDEKWFSQSSHLAQIKDLRDSIMYEQRNLISDRGYMWNNYLDGGNA